MCLNLQVLRERLHHQKKLLQSSQAQSADVASARDALLSRTNENISRTRQLAQRAEAAERMLARPALFAPRSVRRALLNATGQSRVTLSLQWEHF